MTKRRYPLENHAVPYNIIHYSYIANFNFPAICFLFFFSAFRVGDTTKIDTVNITRSALIFGFRLCHGRQDGEFLFSLNFVTLPIRFVPAASEIKYHFIRPSRINYYSDVTLAALRAVLSPRYYSNAPRRLFWFFLIGRRVKWPLSAAKMKKKTSTYAFISHVPQIGNRNLRTPPWDNIITTKYQISAVINAMTIAINVTSSYDYEWAPDVFNVPNAKVAVSGQSGTIINP